MAVGVKEYQSSTGWESIDKLQPFKALTTQCNHEGLRQLAEFFVLSSLIVWIAFYSPKERFSRSNQFTTFRININYSIKVIIRLKQPNSSLVVIFRRRWWYGPGSVSQESHRWYSSVQTLRSMLSTTNNKFIVAFCILGRRSILAEEDLSFSRIRRQRIGPDRPLPSVKRGFRDFGRRKLASKLTRPQS